MEPGARFGSYRLVELLGRGGMGEVWRARHEHLDRPAAIKLIRPDAVGVNTAAGVAALLGRFKREAQATSALRSPNTIELYDFGVSEDGTFYFAMELLEGLNLQRLVETYGCIEAERTIHILRQVCDSLAEAHHAGLIHRDIKPPNIYLCRLGLQFDFVKVLDFGLVKHEPGADQHEHEPNLTLTGMAPGSPAYIAPEIANGSSTVDGRADIYSLGCVGYWLLTGSLVFPADSALDAIIAHVQQEPEVVSARTELSVPAALETLIMDCLAKDPAQRPQAVRDVAARLDGCLLERPWTGDRAEAWWHRHKPAPPPPEDDQPAEDVPLARAAPTPAAPNTATVATPDAPNALAPAGPNALAPLADPVVPMAEPASEPTPVPIVENAQEQTLAETASLPIVNIFSHTNHDGTWQVPPLLKVVNIFGAAELDLRYAELQPGVTEIRCVAVFGALKIIAPPDLDVELAGIGVFGAFQRKDDRQPPALPSVKRVRVTGVAVFGAAELTVKPRE